MFKFNPTTSKLDLVNESPDLSGYILYTGATNDVDLGTHKIDAESFNDINLLGIGDSVGIGVRALKNSTGNNQNVAIGSLAGQYLVDGSKNFLLGANTMVNSTGGSLGMILIGADCGYNMGAFNDYIEKSILIGYNSASSIFSANNCVFLGANTAELVGLGYVDDTVIIGSSVAQEASSVYRATIIGTYACQSSGVYGVYDDAIVIGYKAGMNEADLTGKLWIENSDSSTPLIWGDFITREVAVDGNFDADTYSVGGVAGIDATITTAKLTSGGSDGSMTFTKGILTAQTQAT